MITALMPLYLTSSFILLYLTSFLHFPPFFPILILTTPPFSLFSLFLPLSPPPTSTSFLSSLLSSSLLFSTLNTPTGAALPQRHPCSRANHSFQPELRVPRHYHDCQAPRRIGIFPGIDSYPSFDDTSPFLSISYSCLLFLSLHHFISSHPISFHFVSFYPISTHFILSHFIPSHLISSHPILSHLISSHFISSHPTSFHLFSFDPI